MRILKYAIFSLIPALGVLIVLELVFRGLWIDYHPHDPGNRGRFEEGCYEPSLTRGYAPIPNTCGRNARGFYARDYPEAKADGTLRVMILGDSIADQRQWGERMEASLRDGLGHRGVEVWNGGVGGYDTCSELRVMEEQGRGLHPDVVLLQYCLNDLTLGSSVLMPVDEDTSRLIQGPVQTDLPNVLLRSRLATWVAINYGLLHATSNGGRAPGPEEGYQQSLTCLTRLKEVVEEEGAELIVVLFPPFFTDAPSSTDVMLFRYDYAWAEAAAARLTQEAHLASIRLRGPLAARGRLEEMRNDPRDPWHPSSQTQLVIGDILARDLIGWLKAKQGGGM